MKKVGLRIDVDTWRGTGLGVVPLLEAMTQYQVTSSIFFSVGPDNMGRHIWRLLRPKFLLKMLRTRGLSLYGYDILLAGTFWPGKKIGRGFADIIRQSAEQHEVGLHAWDHFAWQTFVGHWSEDRILAELQRGKKELETILGRPITCAAAPGWRADQRVVSASRSLGLQYQSDCRGNAVFIPTLENGATGTVQIPVSLPTWDEIATPETSPQQFNLDLLARIERQSGLSVYTIHAEVEGLSQLANFKQLLEMAADRQIQFCPLSELLPEDLSSLPYGQIIRGSQSGREGWLGEAVLTQP
jgi:undecaprenyl phosphate-alpha-L-ara4FN deformylase